MKKIVVSLLLAAVLALGLASAALAGDEDAKTEFGADLASLNGSGANGEAELKLENGVLEAEIESEGLAPELGHLQHIHGKEQAASECRRRRAVLRRYHSLSNGHGRYQPR